MKFVKGVFVFIVLCFACFGAYKLFKAPPQLNVSDDDRSYLQEIGVDIQTGNASEHGLSGVMNNVEGAPPVGSSTGFNSTSKSSSAPPSFLSAPKSSEAPPFAAPSAEAPPFIAAKEAPPVAIQVFVPEAVIQQPIETQPVDSPIEVPVEVPVVMPVASPVTLELPPQTAAPPPPTWDGPVSGIDILPSSAPVESAEGVGASGLLWDRPESPPPVSPPIPFDDTPPPIHLEARPGIKLLPTVEPIQVAYAAPESPATLTDQISATYSQPYSQTAERKEIEFTASSPKPLAQNEVPVVSFAPPRSVSPPDMIPSDNTPKQTAAPQPATARTGLKQIPTLADHFSSLPPSSQTASALAPQVRDSVGRFIQAQQTLAQSGNTEKIRTAMVQLSRLYEHEKLNDAERDAMMPTLDWLALNVVYARNRHVLESPYIVKQGDTLELVAEHYNLPPVLLRKINGLTGIQSPSPGSELKVVVGPFDVKISAKRRELVLLLGGLYAGRFPVTFGERTENLRGEFYISAKSDPMMGRILTLNNGAVIQSVGSNGNVSAMSLSLSEQDVREVFDILGERSVVVFED